MSKKYLQVSFAPTIEALAKKLDPLQRRTPAAFIRECACAKMAELRAREEGSQAQQTNGTTNRNGVRFVPAPENKPRLIQHPRRYHPAHARVHNWAFNPHHLKNIERWAKQGPVDVELVEHNGRAMYRVCWDRSLLVSKCKGQERFWLLPAGELYAAGHSAVTRLF